MSYVLHLWEKPPAQPWPASVEEAGRVLARLEAEQPGQNPKFLALAAQLTARYPCITSPQAEDIPESEWAWSDGPLDGKTDRAKYSIGLNTGMLDEVHPFVLEQARQLGLNVTDEQAGQVQLANGVMLSITPAAQPAKSEYDDVPTGRQLDQAVFERLVPFMEERGFKTRKSDRSFKRSFPGGWHRVYLFAEDHWPVDSSFQLGAHSRFDAVTDLIASIAFKERPADQVKNMVTTIIGPAKWMDESAEFIDSYKKEYVVRHHAQLETVIAHALRKLDDRLLPILRQCETIEGLDRLLNPEPVAQSVFFSSYRGGAKHIIAACLARNPRTKQLCEEFAANILDASRDPDLEPLWKCIEYVRSQVQP